MESKNRGWWNKKLELSRQGSAINQVFRPGKQAERNSMNGIELLKDN